MERENKIVMIPLDCIEINKGQLEGLPQNPRAIKKEKYEKLKQNILDYPEMLSMRSLLVYPMDNGKYVIIGGNMRYKAMQALGHAEAPAIVIPKDTPATKLRAYTILDNNAFGEWDWDMLANEWPDDMLDDWGIDLPQTGQKENTKDLSESLNGSYIIEIECSDEQEQERIYSELTEKGYTCRVWTLQGHHTRL